MYNVFYRLLSTSYFRSWFTNLEQTPLIRSQVTSAVETTYRRDQAKLTTREQLEN